MSVALSSISADWNQVRQSLSVLWGSHEEMDRFFSSVFDQLETLAAELAERHRAFLAQREQADRQWQEQAALLEQQRAAMAEQAAQLAQRVSQPGEPSAAASEGLIDLQRMLAETAEQRELLHNAQQTIETHTSRLAELTDKLVQSQRELVQAQDEVRRQQQELEAAAAEKNTAAPQADDGLLSRLQQLEKERTTLAQERMLLEAELDSVRARAAELADSLAQQQRQMAEDRAQWVAELKSQRHIIERFVQETPERDSVRPSIPAGAGTNSSAPRTESSSPGTDPVLDSVMAQFAMLQKDLAQRKKASAPSE